MLLRWDGYLVSERFYRSRKKSPPAGPSCVRQPPAAVWKPAACVELRARCPLHSGLFMAPHHLTAALLEFAFRRLWLLLGIDSVNPVWRTGTLDVPCSSLDSERPQPQSCALAARRRGFPICFYILGLFPSVLLCRCSFFESLPLGFSPDW